MTYSQKTKREPHSEATKQKISNSLKGRPANVLEKNPMWKGDDVSYKGLHQRIRRNLPKPMYCEMCNVVQPYDVANISGKYLGDLSDWQWLCRKCHMTSDRRLEILLTHSYKKGENRH